MSPSTPWQRRRSFILVFFCTFIGAAAQVLIKTGTGALPPDASLIQTAIGILTTPSLFAGYSLYGISAAMLVLALRHAELSLLYPVIALTFVWVAILSVVVFHEQMNQYKLAGVGVIVTGVAVLGSGQRK